MVVDLWGQNPFEKFDWSEGLFQSFQPYLQSESLKLNVRSEQHSACMCYKFEPFGRIVWKFAHLQDGTTYIYTHNQHHIDSLYLLARNQ